jgi:hypothetical protein
VFWCDYGKAETRQESGKCGVLALCYPSKPNHSSYALFGMACWTTHKTIPNVHVKHVLEHLLQYGRALTSPMARLGFCRMNMLPRPIIVHSPFSVQPIDLSMQLSPNAASPALIFPESQSGIAIAAVNYKTLTPCHSVRAFRNPA